MHEYNHLIIKKLVEDYKNTHKGVNYPDIAVFVGIGRDTLYRIMDGRIKYPGVDTLIKFAVFFGITVNDFIDGMNNNNTYTVSEPEIEYHVKSDNESGWKIAYEKQKEITELKLQLSKALNENAPVQGANAG